MTQQEDNQDEARVQLEASVELANTESLVTVDQAEQLLQNRNRVIQNVSAHLSTEEIASTAGLTEQRVTQITGRPQTHTPDPLTPEALKDSPDSPESRVPEADV